MFLLYEKRYLQITLASSELAGQRGQGLNILDNTGLFAMVLTVLLALHEGQPHDSLFNKMCRFSHGLDPGHATPSFSLGS
jgi:hypothetical protein